MRTLTRCGFVVLLLWNLAGPVRAGDFEGVVHMSMSFGEGKSGKTDWSIKGEKARIDRPREDGRQQPMIIDAKTKTIAMLFPDKQAYMELSLAGERDEHLDKMMAEHEVERTGKTDKVAGYTCEIWRIKDKSTPQERTEACIAKGFGHVASFWVEPRKSQPAWITQLIRDGSMALRSIHYDADGKERSRMEVTGVEKKSMDGSLFAIPAGFKKMDTGPLFGGASGGEDFRKTMEERRPRRRQQGDGTSAGSKPDVSEMMKQLGEMMKKNQQGGQ